MTARNEDVLDPDLPRGHMTDSERRQLLSDAEASAGPVSGAPAMAGSGPRQWNQWDFIDALGDGIYGIGVEGCCTFVNRAALEMLGYASADELLGHNMHDLIHHTHPDGTAYPKADCPLLHTLVSGRPVRLSNEMLWCKAGTPFIAEYSSFPITGEGGTITGSVITFNDASLRRNGRRSCRSAAFRSALPYDAWRYDRGLGTRERRPACSGRGNGHQASPWPSRSI